MTKVNNSLARAKQDCEASEVRLQDLQAKNDQMQNEDWERKLKALQADFEEKENLRERT